MALAQVYLKQVNTTVIAAVRDLSSATALKAITPAPGAKLVVVKIEAGSGPDAVDAAKELQQAHNIKAIDVIISNAATRHGQESKVGDVNFDDLREHFEVKYVPS